MVLHLYIYRAEQGEMEKQKAAIKCLLDTLIVVIYLHKFLIACYNNAGDYMYYLHSQPKLRNVKCLQNVYAILTMSEESKAAEV